MAKRNGKRIPRPPLNPLKMLSRYDTQKGYQVVAGRMTSFAAQLNHGDIDARLWDEVALYVTALRNVALTRKEEEAAHATKLYIDTMAAILGRQEGDAPLQATPDEIATIGVYGEALIEWCGYLPAKEIYKAEKAAEAIIRRANREANQPTEKST